MSVKDIKIFLKSLLSRKFILAIVAATVVFGNKFWGWGLSEQDVWTVLTPILAYIGVEGAKDFKEAK